MPGLALKFVLNQKVGRSSEAAGEVSDNSVSDFASDSKINSTQLNQIYLAAIQNYFKCLSTAALAAHSKDGATEQ